jgi:hypothetical protein
MSRKTIEAFYAAFARLDGAAMAACYDENASFDDEAFSLRGRREIGGMWQMLAESARTHSQGVWKIEVSQVTERSAHWEAHYIFSATGRRVHNIIDAEFEFNDKGLITRHRDRFNFWRWTRQALGAPGLLLGWTPMLRAKVRSQAAANLKRYLAKA